MTTINRFIQSELSGNVLVRTDGHVNTTYVYYNPDDEVLFKVHVDCLGRETRQQLKASLPDKTTYSELLAIVGQHKTASVRCTIVQFS